MVVQTRASGLSSHFPETGRCAVSSVRLDRRSIPHVPEVMRSGDQSISPVASVSVLHGPAGRSINRRFPAVVLRPETDEFTMPIPAAAASAVLGTAQSGRDPGLSRSLRPGSEGVDRYEPVSL